MIVNFFLRADSQVMYHNDEAYMLVYYMIGYAT
jgi:hypothetical protein